MPKSELIDLDCELVHETPKAYLLNFGGDKPIWIPKSVADLHENQKQVTLPTSYAIKTGLV